MEEKVISKEESLELIQSMIRLAKSKLALSGFHFLLWGVIVVITSLLNYYLIVRGGGNESFWIWAFTCCFGILIAVIYEYRKQKSDATRTHFDKLHAFLWVGFGITVFFMILICISLRLSPTPFILALIGLGTFVSGFAYAFRPLIAGAIVFWGSAMYCTFVGMPDQLLINAAAVFVGYIIPGLLLWRQSGKVSKQKNVQTA